MDQEKLYSVEELADILKLHPKTVERFIREGRILGRKIGRSWMVGQEALKEYAHAELVSREEPRPVSWAQAGDPGRIQVSAVIELKEKEAGEASRLSSSLTAMLNLKDPSWGPVRYDLVQYPESGRARFVFYGSPGFMAEMMKLFDIVSRQE